MRDWAEDLIRKHEPDRKKFHNIFSIISQPYIFADEEEPEDIGDTAIWDKAKHMINKKLLKEDEIIEPETQVFTDEEILWIQEEVRKDLKRYEKQSSSAGLQILFLIETALRIGEACGLKWSDIDYDKKYDCFDRSSEEEQAVKINQAICFDKKKGRKEELTKLVSDILENSSDMNSNQLAEYIINALNLAS